ncbi:UbiE/COQ5 methyltransferase [Rubripirellula lacrimiformis]|uniref:Demethylmenaquinone methyltransferase n=1 Tax=Rubripirellula lacrimiformis TaxID=1930273 RepID=A0A517NDW2_9BACT|nr:bifunctional demethylmenaquinone methyltransferase/2-methoxy-6-polyprenyl-1,4-benzoquinol methylase UbiE [Rubripirellula lacrimiformis]QDT05317.1 UbiE/COQ5 methyltransferase [Rubripirellula lacrimiformis]
MTGPVTEEPVSRTDADSSAVTGGVDKSNPRVREMFRQIAPHYDRMNHLLSLNIDKHWRVQAVKRLNLKPGHPVLDTCTGTGDLAIAIAAKADPSVNVVGSDFCHAMLEIARDKRQPNHPSADIDFLEADSQALPFPDDTFQCVTVAFGLRNVADTDLGLREMTRVCLPGGQVMVLEFSQPRLIGLRQAYGFYFRNVLPRIGQWFARNDKSAYEYLPESVGQFPDGQALADRMTAAGLLNVRFTPLTCGVATIYEGTKPGTMPAPASSQRDAR